MYTALQKYWNREAIFLLLTEVAWACMATFGTALEASLMMCRMVTSSK